MPIHIDIEVYYDSDTRTIEVKGSENYDAEVFLYNS